MASICCRLGLALPEFVYRTHSYKVVFYSNTITPLWKEYAFAIALVTLVDVTFSYLRIVEISANGSIAFGALDIVRPARVIGVDIGIEFAHFSFISIGAITIPFRSASAFVVRYSLMASVTAASIPLA